MDTGLQRKLNQHWKHSKDITGVKSPREIIGDKILVLSPFPILGRYEKGNRVFGEVSTKKQKYLSPDVHALIERDVTFKKPR